MGNIESPETWGWKQEFFSAWLSAAEARPEYRALLPARVTGREHHQYELVCPDFSGRIPTGAESGLVPMAKPSALRLDGIRVSGRFEYEAKTEADFPTTGDWVLADFVGGTARIQTILPRRSALNRGRAGESAEKQILAANIDVLLLVFALDGGRNFLLRFLERALVVAQNSGASPYVVLNKIDLAETEYRERVLDEVSRAAPSVPAFAVSARGGEGMDRLGAMFSPGDTIGMLGKSGVGKSALVNALGALSSGGPAPSFYAKEGQVRPDDLRGRHTTTSSHLYRLGSGLLLIDSPGIRELKILGEEEDLAEGFPEIVEVARRCRFGDCSHRGEPGCAVREALASGELDPERYQAWLRLAKEQAWFERRVDQRAREEDRLKWKRISKLQKELKRER